jgi:hypothetical protein
MDRPTPPAEEDPGVLNCLVGIEKPRPDGVDFRPLEQPA